MPFRAYTRNAPFWCFKHHTRSAMIGSTYQKILRWRLGGPGDLHVVARGQRRHAYARVVDAEIDQGGAPEMTCQTPKSPRITRRELERKETNIMGQQRQDTLEERRED